MEHSPHQLFDEVYARTGASQDRQSRPNLFGAERAGETGLALQEMSTRVSRFFDLPFAEIARLVSKLLGIEPPFIRSLDRTDWYLGATPLNVFRLSLVYPGVAFPLLWTVLEKKGCSHTSERRELVEKYVQLFGTETIDFVTADREFIFGSIAGYLYWKKGLESAMIAHMLAHVVMLIAIWSMSRWLFQ